MQKLKMSSGFLKYIYICYSPAGRSVLGETVPEVLRTAQGRRPMAVLSLKFKKKNGLKITVFAHSQATNKLVNEAAKDSAWVSGQDRKIPPALGTNQIAGFGGFRQLASLEKNNYA